MGWGRWQAEYPRPPGPGAYKFRPPPPARWGINIGICECGGKVQKKISKRRSIKEDGSGKKCYESLQVRGLSTFSSNQEGGERRGN